MGTLHYPTAARLTTREPQQKRNGKKGKGSSQQTRNHEDDRGVRQRPSDPRPHDRSIRQRPSEPRPTKTNRASGEDDCVAEEERISSEISVLDGMGKGGRRRWRSVPGREKSRSLRPPPPSLAVQALVSYPCPSYSALQCLVGSAGSWEFDVFVLGRLSGGSAVTTLGPSLFHAHRLPQVFHLHPDSLLLCLRLIENGYYPNKFHNAIHAADVAQALHCFLLEDSVSRMLRPLEKLGCLLAALGHDLYHPGRNQKFHENTSHYLCSLYNNVSVLENFHWRCLVSILVESRLLDHFSTQDWHKLLSMLELLILATDMQRQQEYLNQFQMFLQKRDTSAQSDGSNLRLMQILIKCADINNPCRKWDVSQEWSLRASTEFFDQGDLEREMGLPVTSFCDRYATTLSKIQSGFMELVARPLFSSWEKYIQSPLAATMLRHLDRNCAKWTHSLHAELAEAEEEKESGTSGGGEGKDPDAISRSSLEEVADFELQAPQVILQRRRVSASALLTTPYRRPSFFRGSEKKISRRISLPAKMSSATTWTIRTPHKGTFSTQSTEFLAGTSDSQTVLLMPPPEAESELEATGGERSGVWQPSQRVLPDLTEVSSASAVTTPRSPFGGLDEDSLNGNEACRLESELSGGEAMDSTTKGVIVSEEPPIPTSTEEDPEASSSTGLPNPSRTKRRYSEPVIPSFIDIQGSTSSSTVTSLLYLQQPSQSRQLPIGPEIRISASHTCDTLALDKCGGGGSPSWSVGGGLLMTQSGVSHIQQQPFRRSSLPVPTLGLNQCEFLRLNEGGTGSFTSMCSSASSGSERLQPVGAF